MAEQTTVPTSLRRAVAHVDLAAISANTRLLRSKLSPSTELCAVVKADGYGHGIERVAVAAVEGGASRLAVVTTAEAALVAELDLGVGLLVLAPIPADDLIATIETGAELTAWTPEQVGEIDRAAQLLGRTVAIHVKLDTGMGRFGARTAEQAHAALAAAAAGESVQPKAVWTHFATADEPGDDYFDLQLERFAEFADAAKQRYPDILAHAANSAAVLRDPASHFDFVRCGIAIYGLDPFHEDATARGLAPALSLHSYVASVRDVAAGESVGYGRRFVAPAQTRVATIPIGYGDGWRRVLTNNCYVLIAGRRFSLRGTVSMDSITVEVGADSTVEPGAPVTLIGTDDGEHISAEEVARRASTINYEITCGLLPRTARDYSPVG